MPRMRLSMFLRSNMMLSKKLLSTFRKNLKMVEMNLMEAYEEIDCW
ncbi:hypothetical protein PanWU01x14_209840 [Parasponia andersonii]|uniref:Uncharacterized protein n=1 Tax=Parasponia andersonii TaxID=3476 RepID=A0A2P5BUC2_PARAD|nr:hypothetical protein PanWU01x14_209840 [Parasponia andersonii]